MMIKVSVLLPVYNAASTLKESINSVIEQTFSDWELIVINDGSIDNTEEIIKSYSDSRIKYVKNETNKGLIYTLNRGISLAKGKYIARMDADDICYFERFEKQVAFMDNNPDVIICGTQIEYFGTKSSNYKKLIFPLKDMQLKEMLATSTCFAHPSVMIKKSVLDDSGILYNMNYKNAEDYGLWVDLASYGKYANLKEVLLRYRVSDTQISQPSNPQTIKSVLACRKKYLLTYLDEILVQSLFNNPINISILKVVKQQTSNKKILESCYLSLENYNLSSILYYIGSFDAFRLGILPFVRFMKRCLKGKSPIYYKL